MREAQLTGGSALQTPPAGLSNLDHIAHFVPDQGACRHALMQLGFAPAPFSLQYHRLQEAEALVPAGTGNHCVMLQSGYLEFLVPLAETGVAAQLRLAIARYVGVHSIVFGTADAKRDYRRLQAAGFAPSPPIDLQRPIDTVDGAATARFTVVRVPAAAMAEGRIQFCQHHTERLVWQRRWLAQPNGAVGLQAALVCVEDLDAAAERYARFTGVRARCEPGVRVFQLHRGRLELHEVAGFCARFEIEVPARPWIAGCELRSGDLARTRAVLADRGVAARDIDHGRLLVHGPPPIGGVFLFTEA